MTHTPQDIRLAALHRWLGQLRTPPGLAINTLVPVSGDASFRRYFRIQGDGASYIAMDAPPPHEDCRPFVDIAQRLHTGGLHVPEIHAQDLDQGFLLLSDLGQQSFFDAIQLGLDDTGGLQQHYRSALQALVRLQQCPTQGLPVYDEARLHEELTVFPHWYLQVHHGLTPDADTQSTLAQIFEHLVHQAVAQPRVLVHRDYHSPNLMLGEAPGFVPGILDFQDALAGPLSYDIASLVMDARTTWDEPQQLDWAIRYWEYARAAGLPVPNDFAQFHIEYEWMGLQRNLRILGVFARLSHRDGKHHYLAHIPRVQRYVRQVAERYRLFHPLVRLLDLTEQVPITHGFSF